VKTIYSVLWAAIVFQALGKRVHRMPPTFFSEMVHNLEWMYLWALPVVHILTSAFPAVAEWYTKRTPGAETSGKVSDGGDALPQLSQMQFLPLMVTSVVCATGMVWAYMRLSWLYLRS